jgi:predicted transcriptional regulator
MSTKNIALAAIAAMPDDATLQDAAEKLALLAAIEKGRRDVREGRTRPQEEVEELLPTWRGR